MHGYKGIFRAALSAVRMRCCRRNMGFACGMVFGYADPALSGIPVDSVHSINGYTSKAAMGRIGLIVSPGMQSGGKNIVEIRQNKKIKGDCLF